MQPSRHDSAIPTKRVVIVDDSLAIRNWLRFVLEQDPRLVVVGEAESAQVARKVIKEVDPDVITLDIEMPGMNGLDFLEKLMSLYPKPVVMISGATQSNSEATITALSLGAVDCLLKPGVGADEGEVRRIARRVHAAACSVVQPLRPQTKPNLVRRGGDVAAQTPLVVIGSSTGGVGALERVLADVHVDGPPIVIVQHMPGTFLESFVKSLDRNLEQDVALARAGEILERGQIRMAPAEGSHTVVRRVGGSWKCGIAEEDGSSLHCPSVDMLFHSAEYCSKDVIGVILTGLGRDGAEGLRKLRDGGAHSIGQDAATSVVYGMPRAAWQLGAVQEQLPLDQIGEAINRAVAQHASKARRIST